MECAGIHQNWIDRMLGHKPKGSAGPYSKPTDQQLQEAYIKGYPHLSVEIKIDAEKLRDLESKVDSKDGIIEALLRNGKEKDQEIEDLKKNQEKLAQKIDRILEKIGQVRR
jgi:small-conductance mechanosensitive channel